MMHARVAAVTGMALALLAGAGFAVWRHSNSAVEPTTSVALPVPPFPPRIASGDEYERCLAELTEDPEFARQFADSWGTRGGGDGAAHCQGLALIATGSPETGAERLEHLAAASIAPDQARAIVYGQAAQARLMAGQDQIAYEDTTKALNLAPEDTELLIDRGAISLALEHWDGAIDDLNQALKLDAHRSDALVLRAAAWRQQNRLDLAMTDVERAAAIDPDDAEALLERGIERQRLGDPAGARADWQRARAMDPNSTAADLAEQNLALLEAGPNQR